MPPTLSAFENTPFQVDASLLNKGQPTVSLTNDEARVELYLKSPESMIRIGARLERLGRELAAEVAELERLRKELERKEWNQACAEHAVGAGSRMDVGTLVK